MKAAQSTCLLDTLQCQNSTERYGGGQAQEEAGQELQSQNDFVMTFRIIFKAIFFNLFTFTVILKTIFFNLFTFTIIQTSKYEQRDALSVTVIIVGNKISNPGINPGQDCVSLCVNSLWKDMNPCVLPQLWVSSRTDWVF